MTNLLLWNARGISNKRAEIEQHINNFDVSIITETKISCNKDIYFSGYKVVKSLNRENSGGIAIIIKKDIDFDTIEPWILKSNNIEAIGIRVKNTSIKFNLIAVYRKPYDIEPKSAWDDILKFRGHEANSIIAGDFNAYHSGWNCSNIDRNDYQQNEDSWESDHYPIKINIDIYT
ncbi:uncharacterized protein LOC115246167 [Formica exsecta]|uniref:uncharacterized protein LOC115246167 n=1 Tax=Formica exsecta TaxID=72781 RepID=UPI001142D9B0|nr:uncharacterized protein LOC115246167 [Formica exsecta]